MPSNAKPCELKECVSLGGHGTYRPKWKIRVCSECYNFNHCGGLDPNRKNELIKLGVPEEAIEFLPNGNIRIPHWSETPET